MDFVFLYSIACIYLFSNHRLLVSEAGKYRGSLAPTTFFMRFANTARQTLVIYLRVTRKDVEILVYPGLRMLKVR